MDIVDKSFIYEGKLNIKVLWMIMGGGGGWEVVEGWEG